MPGEPVREITEFLSALLDLRPGPEALFRNFHKDCIQRKIRRAAREALTYEEGRSDELLAPSMP